MSNGFSRFFRNIESPFGGLLRAFGYKNANCTMFRLPYSFDLLRSS
jgi:hypothetical protein